VRNWSGRKQATKQMQARDLPNKRYMIFLSQQAISLHYENYASFREAWSALERLVLDMQAQGSSKSMIHATADECLAANPDGIGGNSYQKQWPACTNNVLSKDSELRRVMGEGCIVLVQW
jgi:hypothetical protein